MPSIRIVCIVEGHGEVSALPVLIRRMAAEIDPSLYVDMPMPIRIKRDKLLNKPAELDRAVALAALKAQGGGVFILLDADTACPAELGPKLLAAAKDAHSEVPMSVVLAKTEYESWFLAAAESLRGRRGLPDDLEAPDAPESIRGAKEWLSARIIGPHAYSPTVDQAGFSDSMDLVACRSASDSFDKCYRELEALVMALHPAPPKDDEE